MTIRTTLSFSNIKDNKALLVKFMCHDSPSYISVNSSKDIYVADYFKLKTLFTDKELAGNPYRLGGFIMMLATSKDVHTNLAWHRNVHNIFDEYDAINNPTREVTFHKKWIRKI